MGLLTSESSYRPRLPSSSGEPVASMRLSSSVTAACPRWIFTTFRIRAKDCLVSPDDHHQNRINFPKKGYATDNLRSSRFLLRKKLPLSGWARGHSMEGM